MPQANLANQALLEEFKTQFVAILNLEQEIDIREEHISLLFMHLKNFWKPSLDTHSLNMLPRQKNIRGISDFISKHLHETVHKAEQTQQIRKGCIY